MSERNVPDKETKEAVPAEKQADGGEGQDAVLGKMWRGRLLDLTPAEIKINPYFKSHYLYCFKSASCHKTTFARICSHSYLKCLGFLLNLLG